ncbi:hypothetical protein SVIOM342S_03991 [Streptomyces violaceorubidus]
MLRVACSGEGFARARVFTPDTLRGWSLDHRGDELVGPGGHRTRLQRRDASAVPSAAAGVPEIRLGLALGPGDLTLSVSDPGDDLPVFHPSGASSLREHGRGLCIVDALSAEGVGLAPRARRRARRSGPRCRPAPSPDPTAAEGPHTMRSAPTPEPSIQRTDRHTSPGSPRTTTLARGTRRVPWSDIQDSTGSAAAIPRLLRKVARGDAETARAALGDLRKRICQYGFVVEAQRPP